MTRRTILAAAALIAGALPISQSVAQEPTMDDTKSWIVNHTWITNPDEPSGDSGKMPVSQIVLFQNDSLVIERDYYDAEFYDGKLPAQSLFLEVDIARLSRTVLIEGAGKNLEIGFFCYQKARCINSRWSSKISGDVSDHEVTSYYVLVPNEDNLPNRMKTALEHLIKLYGGKKEADDDLF